MKKNKEKKQEKEQMEKKEEEQQPQKKKRNWAQIVCWSSLGVYWIVGVALSIYSGSAYSDRWHRIINYSKGSSNDVIDNILLYVYQYPRRLLFFIFLLLFVIQAILAVFWKPARKLWLFIFYFVAGSTMFLGWEAIDYIISSRFSRVEATVCAYSVALSRSGKKKKDVLQKKN